MSFHEFNTLHIIHVVSVLLLVGCTSFAFAGALETKKRVLAFAGAASLLVLLTGLRMWQTQFSFAVAGWIIVKLFCWLGLSAIGGFAHRRRGKAGVLMVVTILLVATAVAMVYVKPF